MTTYTKFSLAAKIRLTKNLQVKYFTGENIPIYGIFRCIYIINFVCKIFVIKYLCNQWPILQEGENSVLLSMYTLEILQREYRSQDWENVLPTIQIYTPCYAIITTIP